MSHAPHDNPRYDKQSTRVGDPKRYCLKDNDPLHLSIVAAIAESFWGEGVYPFNAATGHIVKFESEKAAAAVENALIHSGRLVRPITPAEEFSLRSQALADLCEDDSANESPDFVVEGDDFGS